MWYSVGEACCRLLLFSYQQSFLVPEMAQNSEYFFVDPTLAQGEAPGKHSFADMHSMCCVGVVRVGVVRVCVCAL